jgi:uncharacterized membrane protein
MQRLKKLFGKVLDEYFIHTLVVAALVIIATMTIITLATSKPERYTALGLLNAQGQAGNFPANCSWSATLNLRFDVINDEGSPQLYQVDAYLGDQATTIDARTGVQGASLMAGYQQVVGNGETWEQPVGLGFNVTNTGERSIIFALWIFNSSNATFTFTNQTVHVWVNILGP